VLAEKLMD